MVEEKRPPDQNKFTVETKYCIIDNESCCCDYFSENNVSEVIFTLITYLLVGNTPFM